MRTFRFLLLIVWSAVALLGHSGIHALAEASGVCCSAEQAEIGSTQGHTQHRHSHEHSSCHHEHSHESTAPEHGKGHHSHDSANCRLCDWFLKIGSSFHWVAQVVANEQVTVYSDRSVAREFGDPLPLPLTRGPPATI
ncbi:MAG: hypothetical protein U0996_14260 [Planctomycetaceae bacterium]